MVRWREGMQEMFYYIEKNEKNTTYYLFGKKILRIRRSPVKKLEQEVEALSSIVRSSVTASTMPKAEGLLRDIQMADLRILREFDRVAREAGMTWWLDFGTLLGAVRHGGFIPWDDDIDVCMVREDYNRLIETFTRLTQDDELEAVHYSNPNGKVNLIKVRHRRLKDLCVDVFPVDVCREEMSDEEKLKFSKELKQMIGTNRRKGKEQGRIEDYHARFLSLRDKYLPKVCAYDDAEAKTVYYGCEFCHERHRYNAFDHGDIFPVKMISFEGEQFPCVAQPDRYLTYVFGDYMGLPKEVHVHIDTKKYTPKEIFAIRAYGRGE